MRSLTGIPVLFSSDKQVSWNSRRSSSCRFMSCSNRDSRRSFERGEVHLSFDKIFIGGLEVLDEFLFVALAVMDITAKLFEPHLFQPVVDHIECGAFFTHKENVLAAGHKIGDQIGDRLALAGAGRPLDNITFSSPAFQDRLRLRRGRRLRRGTSRPVGYHPHQLRRSLRGWSPNNASKVWCRSCRSMATL